MNDSPKGNAQISVAMCTYNGARYLKEQLETIAAQTRQPLELVVTDDRSTDATLDILKKFSLTCAFPVRVYQNPLQLGSTQNFDKAIRLCTGDYIALADQDDRWKPEKLEVLGALLDHDTDATMAFSDATLIDDASGPTGGMLWESLRFPAAVRERFAKDAPSVLVQRPVVTGATMLFRRSLLERFAGVPVEWVHDGWITWMGVLWGKVLFTEAPLTDYRVHTLQQLGVGAVSFTGRMTGIRNRQRELYARIAVEFDLLRVYVEEHVTGKRREAVEVPIAEAVKFFRIRAEAPVGRISRLFYFGRNFKRYWQLSGYTIRAMVRDFLMD